MQFEMPLSCISWQNQCVPNWEVERAQRLVMMRDVAPSGAEEWVELRLVSAASSQLTKIAGALLRANLSRFPAQGSRSGESKALKPLESKAEQFNVVEVWSGKVDRPGHARERPLAWRPLTRDAAVKLYEERLRALHDLGFCQFPAHTAAPEAGDAQVVDLQAADCEHWDWLAELIDRRVARITSADPGELVGAALRHAMTALGLRRGALTHGLAHALAIEDDHLTHPRAHDLAHMRLDRLGAVIEAMCEHDDPTMRTLGWRWLAVPEVAYAVQPAFLVEWLRLGAPWVRSIADRIATEGLALVGPYGLETLARESSCPHVRCQASVWAQRIRPHVSH